MTNVFLQGVALEAGIQGKVLMPMVAVTLLWCMVEIARQ